MRQKLTGIWVNSSEPFAYAPLKTTCSIRVVSFSGDTATETGSNDAADETLQCTMFQIDLEKKPVYRALSYTWDMEYTTVWGKLDREKSIICDGKQVAVGDNLFLALRNLRSRLGKIPIWIDSICINQHDDAEKSRQIRMMDRIYSEAELVHVWLGKDIPPRLSTTTMKWIQANCGSSSSSENQDQEAQSSSQIPRNLYQIEIDEVLASLHNDVNNPRKRTTSITESLRNTTVASHLPYLFCRRWFTRVWVLQEAILARALEFSIGDCTVTDQAMFEALERAIELQRTNIAKRPRRLQSYQDYDDERLMHLHSVRVMFEMRRFRALNLDSNRDQTKNMHYMLLGWNRRATCAHDKVYGLLGLFRTDPDQNSGQNNLEVDYKLGAETVFATYTFSMLSQDRRLTALSLGRGVEINRSPAVTLMWTEAEKGFWGLLALRAPAFSCGLDKMQSWAIDFTCALKARPLVISHDHSYRAGGHGQNGEADGPGSSQAISLERASLTLLIHGHCLDEVQLIGEDSSVFQPLGYRYFSGKLLTILSAVGHRYQHTGETTLRAAARTLTADHSGYLADAKKTFLRKWGGVGFLNWLVGTVELALMYQTDTYADRWMERILKNPIDAQEKNSGTEKKRQNSLELQTCWSVFLREVDIDGHVQDTIDTLGHGLRTDVFSLVFRYLYRHRRLFLTKLGYLGIGPSSIRAGDAIYIIPGAAVPFALRTAAPDSSGRPRWALVGETYVHGVMNGEAMENPLNPLDQLRLT